MIRVCAVKKIYPDGDRKILALDIAEAVFETGSQWALTGPSGSGKSTLLHCLAGIIRPTEGQISVDGEELTSFPDKTLDQWRSAKVGYIFQDFNLLESLHVEDNIRLGAYFGHVKQDQDYQERLEQLLTDMDIRDLRHKYPKHLSRGEQQRVAVARALIKKPVLLLADEPTASLDAENSQRVMDLLTSYCHAAEATLLVATHDRDTQTYLANTLSLQKGGR